MSTEVLPFYLAGRWCQSDRVIEVRSPYDDRLVGTAACASREQIAEAIAAGATAAGAMRSLASWQRSAICRQIALSITDQTEQLAALMSAEVGKAIKDCRSEIARAAYVFQLAAEEAARIEQDYIQLDQVAGNESRFGLIRRFPRGLVLGITPFNFPLNLIAHKIAPAIAAGCPILLKPASKTPLIALKLAELISRTSLPAGGLSILPAEARTISEFVADPAIRLISFTGSGQVGWRIKEQAWRIPVVLELGGNAGVIVADDADPDWAVGRLLFGAFTSAGQSCISVQRVFLHESIFPILLERLITGAKRLQTGNPADPHVDIGPLVDTAAVTRTKIWLDEAVAGGAKIVTGGTVEGRVVAPTIITGTTDSMSVCAEELFAPVMVVEPYESLTDAIDRLNNSRYGLQAGLFTNRMSDILLAFDQIDCGGVIINDVPTWRTDPMPYGGVKESGTGREGVRYAIESMTEMKLLAVRP